MCVDERVCVRVYVRRRTIEGMVGREDNRKDRKRTDEQNEKEESQPKI